MRVSTVIDYNQVAISVLMQELKRTIGPGMQPDKNFFRHMVLQTIRHHIMSNRHRGGKTIIAADTSGSWRSHFYPNYKIGRKLAPQGEPVPGQVVIDFSELLDVMAEVRDAMMLYFPVKVIRSQGAEADDVIGVLARRAVRLNEPLHIVSGDKDFRQLHKPDVFGNSIITQYAPAQKTNIVESDPLTQLGLMVLCGDAGDGVPDITCHDDWFKNNILFPNEKTKKTVLSAKMKKEWLAYWDASSKKIDAPEFNKFAEDVCSGKTWSRFLSSGNCPSTEEIVRRVRRNLTLVDLSMTPDHIVTDVDTQVESQQSGDVHAAERWMYQMGLPRLMETASEFV